ncbi:hypothetical protein [Saccharothrix xinjiangensis]|uniref:Uncharacterized protein n=1 Tax=Saccharothrix xinjiangensis TaxID=204798 RepID=A0ABV9XSI7_9PSEU
MQMIEHPLILRHHPCGTTTGGTTFGIERINTRLLGTGAPEDAVTRAFAPVTDWRTHTRNTGFAHRLRHSTNT